MVMQTVAQTPQFAKKAKGLFTDEEVSAIETTIAFNPHAGDVIEGTGGIRKLRVQSDGKGKSKGARVIYYVYDEDCPIYLITCFGKKEKLDLSADEKKIFAEFAKAIKRIQRARRRK